MPELTVVVVHHAAPEWCRDTATSLLASKGIDVRLTVVHNGGDVPPLPASAGMIIADRNLGYAGGANLGLGQWLRATEEPWVGLACHDVCLETDALEKLLLLGEGSADIGIVGPSMSEGKKEGGGIAPVDRQWASGTIMLIRRECLLSVGRFDERFGSYVEDRDFGIRARRLGWRVVTMPTIHARHRGSSSANAPALTSANHALLEVFEGSGWRGRLGLCLLAAASTVRSTVSRRHAPYARARWRALAASVQRPQLAWDPSVTGDTETPA